MLYSIFSTHLLAGSGLLFFSTSVLFQFLLKESCHGKKRTMSFTPSQQGNGSRPIALVSQLRQQALHMQHIDEMFLWLSRAMVSQWQVPLVQFWAMQADTAGQYHVELRALASQDPSLPSSAHVNQPVADLVKQLLREQRGVSPLPVTTLFSSSHASLLARHNIHYWGGYFLREHVMLPPKKGATRATIATPLNMITTLFLQDPPSERLGRALHFVFQQGLRIAASQELFSASTSMHTHDFVEKAPQQTDLDLSTLRPQRTQRIEEIQAGNPFANATIIPDKKARHMYSFINGQRDVATLIRLTNLEQKEAVEALHLLLQQEKIQLQDAEGNAIEASLLATLFR